jgi:hypothetical protein
MPWRIIHLVDSHLGVTPVWGKFGVDELKEYDAVALASMSRGQHPLIHNIYDCTGLEALPPLVEMGRLQVARHPKVGWVIFVGIQNDMLKFMLSITTQMFGQRLRFMNSHAEALQFMQQMDSTLPDLSRFDVPALVAQIHAGKIPDGVVNVGP